jgi:hypothetical protein
MMLYLGVIKTNLFCFKLEHMKLAFLCACDIYTLIYFELRVLRAAVL